MNNIEIEEIQEIQEVAVKIGKVSESQKRAIKKYYEKNTEQIVQRQIQRAKERYHTDSVFREMNQKRMLIYSRNKKKELIKEV